MKILDLFAGIGGFSLGFEMASDVFETVAFCEYDEKAQLVLKKHWPEVPIYKDVRDIDGKKYRGTVSIVCGGIPCQPWSVAGKKRKDKDDRHLWPEMFRIIRGVRPRWVIVENVQGFVNQEMGFSATKLDLEGEGYETRSFLLPACGVSAPHQRYRIFVVGFLSDADSSRCASTQQESQYERAEISSGGGANGLECGADVADSKCSRPQGQGQYVRSLHSEKVAAWKTSWVDYGGERWEKIWDVEPSVGRVANGVPKRVDRLKQLGNAVVPQLIQRIAESILEAEGMMNEQP